MHTVRYHIQNWIYQISRCWSLLMSVYRGAGLHLVRLRELREWPVQLRLLWIVRVGPCIGFLTYSRSRWGACLASLTGVAREAWLWSSAYKESYSWKARGSVSGPLWRRTILAVFQHTGNCALQFVENHPFAAYSDWCCEMREIYVDYWLGFDPQVNGCGAGLFRTEFQSSCEVWK